MSKTCKNMKKIVLDKSFLQGKKETDITRLCEKEDVFMAETLFYELITTESEIMQRCFGHIPNRYNPFKIVQLANIFCFERENKCAYGGLSKFIFKSRYTFNSMLRNGSYRFSGNIEKDRQLWQEKIWKKTDTFVNHCQTVVQFFPELKGISIAHIPEAIVKARRKVARNYAFVSDISSSIFGDENKQAQIDANWALFRLIQCEMLSALRYFGKWQGSLPTCVGKNFNTKMEHSMLDVDYVVLGVLAGGLASTDDDMKEDFRLVCPHGKLIS